jgi:hypothetical protein
MKAIMHNACNDEQRSNSGIHSSKCRRQSTNLRSSGMWRRTLHGIGHVDSAPSPHFEPRERQLRLKTRGRRCSCIGLDGKIYTEEKRSEISVRGVTKDSRKIIQIAS